MLCQEGVSLDFALLLRPDSAKRLAGLFCGRERDGGWGGGIAARPGQRLRRTNRQQKLRHESTVSKLFVGGGFRLRSKGALKCFRSDSPTPAACITASVSIKKQKGCAKWQIKLKIKQLVK